MVKKLFETHRSCSICRLRSCCKGLGLGLVSVYLVCVRIGVRLMVGLGCGSVLGLPL